VADKIDIRQLGASAIVGLQAAIGAKVTYLEALKEWDGMTPEQRLGTLKAYELMYDDGYHVILDPRVKTVPYEN
jgi:hypothetical protein